MQKICSAIPFLMAVAVTYNEVDEDGVPKTLQMGVTSTHVNNLLDRFYQYAVVIDPSLPEGAEVMPYILRHGHSEKIGELLIGVIQQEMHGVEKMLAQMKGDINDPRISEIVPHIDELIVSAENTLAFFQMLLNAEGYSYVDEAAVNADGDLKTRLKQLLSMTIDENTTAH